MANPEHLQILQQGVEAWNTWRDQQTDITPDLSEANLRLAILSRANLRRANLRLAILSRANLRRANLSEVNFREANLREANLRRANLSEVNFREANLSGTNLREANLRRANLREANLNRADLREADLRLADLSLANLREANLSGTNLREANLREANLREANLRLANLGEADLTGADVSQGYLYETVFGDTDLTAVQGLKTCTHYGPSTLDHRTLAKSGPLPLAFLRGCGLPDALIDYLPSLLNESFQFYSCFISYSSIDEDFCRRLHGRLQDAGLRVWFAPHDIGDPVAYGQKTALRPLAIYRRKSLRSSTGLAPHFALRDGCWLGLNCSQASPNETAGRTWTIFRGRRPTPPSIQLSFSVFSQCFGFLQVGGVKPLGEPAVDLYRLPASSVRGVTRGRRCRQR